MAEVGAMLSTDVRPDPKSTDWQTSPKGEPIMITAIVLDALLFGSGVLVGFAITVAAIQRRYHR